MKILVLTNLFPNHLEPTRGIFNKQQFAALSRLCELRVVAPVPWFPKVVTSNARSVYSRIHAEEVTAEQIRVYHPRYFMTPKIGRSLYGLQYFLGVRRTVQEIQREFAFDAIFATWAYPDAFAGALLAREHNKPLVIKVHGTDVNVTSRYLLRRQMMRYAFQRAERIIAVSHALKARIASLGIDSRKIVVIGNGIDAHLFYPRDRQACRKKLGLDAAGKQLVYVGNLVAIKGLGDLLQAIHRLPAYVALNVVGDGPLRSNLQSAAARLNLDHRVTFWGKRGHAEIPDWINAADALVLPSLNEGCPNIILEALACGTPVVATAVGAIPEILDDDKGVLVKPADPAALAMAIETLLASPAANKADNGSRQPMSWGENATAVYATLEDAMENREARR